MLRLGKLIHLRVIAPSHLDAFDFQYRSATMEFLESLRSKTLIKGIGVTVDLSRVEQIRPSAALLLLAEIDRTLNRAIHTAALRVARPADPVIDAVMNQIGIYRGNTDPSPESQRDDVRHWRAATGVLSEGQKSGSILEFYDGRLAEGITKGLYDGLVEAMTNTVHHAYAGQVGEELKRHIGKRWWMLSQERDGLLTVAICDLGIGIPRSLPRSETFSNAAVKALWRILGLDNSDGSAIKVAVELGRTRTGEPGRGKGLSEIVRAVNLSTSGRVYICSNRGVYASADGKDSFYNHSHSVRGTLIHWTVPVSDD